MKEFLDKEQYEEFTKYYELNGKSDLRYFLEIIPRAIYADHGIHTQPSFYNLNISYPHCVWEVTYKNIKNEVLFSIHSEELIDALFDTLLYIKQHNCHKIPIK